MKTKTFIVLAFLFGIVSLSAQTNGVPLPDDPVAGGGIDGLLLLLIPVGVPLIIAIGKWVVPKLPPWTLPILAPALGALLDFINSFAQGTPPSPLIGALLGSAGVGIRELVDQVKQKALGQTKT